jgi:hypothetical protein
MKIYCIYQEVNTGYDSYDSAVVIAESEDAARRMHPSRYHMKPYHQWNDKTDMWCWSDSGKKSSGLCTWATPDNVGVTYLGEAEDGSISHVVCASFNAG